MTKPTKEQIEKCAEELHPEFSDEWLNTIKPENMRSEYSALHQEAKEERLRIASTLTRHFGQEEQPTPTESVDEIVEKWDRIYWDDDKNMSTKHAIKSALLEATAAETARADRAEWKLRELKAAGDELDNAGADLLHHGSVVPDKDGFPEQFQADPNRMLQASANWQEKTKGI